MMQPLIIAVVVGDSTHFGNGVSTQLVAIAFDMTCSFVHVGSILNHVEAFAIQSGTQ